MKESDVENVFVDILLFYSLIYKENVIENVFLVVGRILFFLDIEDFNVVKEKILFVV